MPKKEAEFQVRTAKAVLDQLTELKNTYAENMINDSDTLTENVGKIIECFQKNVDEAKDGAFDYEVKENDLEEAERQRNNTAYAAILLERLQVIEEAKYKIETSNDIPEQGADLKIAVSDLSEETVKALEEFETELENAKADEFKMAGMNYSGTLYSGIQKKVKDCTVEETKCPEGVDPQKFFDEQKAIVRELAARAIVIQSLDHQIRSMAVQGELTADEVKEAYRDYFDTMHKSKNLSLQCAFGATDNINIIERAKDIKMSPNFKLMMDDINTPEKLEKLKAEMGQQSKLLKHLAAYNKLAMSYNFSEEELMEPDVQIPVNSTMERFHNPQLLKERAEREIEAQTLAGKTDEEFKEEIKAIREARKVAPAAPKMGH